MRVRELVIPEESAISWVLAQAFSAVFDATEKARVRAHLDNSTRVLCGEDAHLFLAPGAG